MRRKSMHCQVLKSGTEEDRERANALREEILSAYNVEEKEIDTAASTS